MHLDLLVFADDHNVFAFGSTGRDTTVAKNRCQRDTSSSVTVNDGACERNVETG